MMALKRTAAKRRASPVYKHIAFAWYTPDQWLRIKKIASDPEVFNATYQDWIETVTQACAKYELQGSTVHQIWVDVDEFIAWCDIKQRPLDGASRSAFALWKFENQPPTE